MFRKAWGSGTSRSQGYQESQELQETQESQESEESLESQESEEPVLAWEREASCMDGRYTSRRKCFGSVLKRASARTACQQANNNKNKSDRSYSIRFKEEN